MKIKVGTIIEFETKKHTIKERIDGGGNGTVWKVEIPGDSCTFAIKVLNNDATKNSDKLARFKKECQFCKDTYSGHIVKVLDYVVEKGKAYN